MIYTRENLMFIKMYIHCGLYWYIEIDSRISTMHRAVQFFSASVNPDMRLPLTVIIAVYRLLSISSPSDSPLEGSWVLGFAS